MTRIRADCTLSEESLQGVRLSVFQFTYEGNPEYEESEILSLQIINEDHDLKLLWQVDVEHYGDCDDLDPSIAHWTCNKITLLESNKKISGHFEINGIEQCSHEEGLFDKTIVTGSFDSKSLPFEKELSIWGSENHHNKITIKVFSEEKSLITALENYKSFIQNKNFCDITFFIGKEEIPAHRAILAAQSEVFSRMFEGKKLEKESQTIELEGTESTIFKLLLQFIYSQRLDCNDTDEYVKLMKEANKYSIVGLVDICEYRISKDLQVENVVNILIIADSIKANLLKKACFEIITECKKHVSKTVAYKNMINSRADLVSELQTFEKSYNKREED